MEDSDFYAVLLLILGLSVTGILHARLLRRHDDQIRYLMDNSAAVVSRETEAP